MSIMSGSQDPSMMPVTLAASLPAVWKAMMLDLPLTLAAQSLRFVGHRLQAQADFLSSLAQCRSFTDAVTVQSAFAQAAMNDYSVGAVRLMETQAAACLRLD